MAAKLGIFHLTRTDEAEYGDYTAHIIVAGSDTEARLMAGRVSKRNGIIWADPNIVACEQIGTASVAAEPNILMSEMLGE